MSRKIYLEQIYKYAKEKKYDAVRQILDMNLFTYREAQLYIETIKADYETSACILKQATCKCGNIVSKWYYNKTPTCASCLFNKSMQNIEYGNI